MTMTRRDISRLSAAGACLICLIMFMCTLGAHAINDVSTDTVVVDTTGVSTSGKGAAVAWGRGKKHTTH